MNKYIEKVKHGLWRVVLSAGQHDYYAEHTYIFAAKHYNEAWDILKDVVDDNSDIFGALILDSDTTKQMIGICDNKFTATRIQNKNKIDWNPENNYTLDWNPNNNYSWWVSIKPLTVINKVNK